jgi:branched-chain amino acid transport system ATP-binding protein
MLKVKGIAKTFSGYRALSDVTFSVNRGQLVAVIGPNGAGKSTLFNIISGHLRPDRGTVTLRDRDITGAAPYAICRLGMGRSFQRSNIFPNMTVFENMQSTLIAHKGMANNFWSSTEGLFNDETNSLLESIGLLHCSGTVGAALSYGNQKQIELGIAIAGNPDILLLDEPTAGMPATETLQMMQMLQSIASKRGLTLLFTEHDMEFVFSMAHKIIVLHQGRIIADGTPTDVRANAEVRRVYLGGA